MKTREHIPLPPRLSMDAYVDFVDASFLHRDVAKALKQKALEERIERRFSIPPPPQLVESRTHK